MPNTTNMLNITNMPNITYITNLHFQWSHSESHFQALQFKD